MKKLTLLFATALLVVFMSESCKSSKDSATSSNTATEEASATGTADLILSFFSPGNGIDRGMLEEVTTYMKTSFPDVKYSRVSWGKEGEVDLCFDLSSLKEEAKADFIENIKAMIDGSERVRLKQDQACRTPRK
jgi:ATP phosphoribosyltransferase